MSYDNNKVNFTAEEHEAAQAADRIYEAVADAASNGLDGSDIGVVAVVLQPIMALFRYLATGSRKEFARRLIGIGVMLERDNELLGNDEPA